MENKQFFRLKKLNMLLRLVHAQESLIEQAKAVGLGTASPAFIPFTQTKIPVSYTHLTLPTKRIV